MDEALKEAGKRVRSKGEPIALPVPTWSIENWLLSLLEESEIDEERQSKAPNLTWKHIFEHKYGDDEGAAIKAVANAWISPQPGELPSLTDGREEVERIWP
ncbi:hypothetical protein IV102_17905 [bacterium]|nr:hypothetical protein [bacterium]